MLLYKAIHLHCVCCSSSLDDICQTYVMNNHLKMTETMRERWGDKMRAMGRNLSQVVTLMTNVCGYITELKIMKMIYNNYMSTFVV